MMRTVRAGWPPFQVWRERRLGRSPRLSLHMRMLEVEARIGKARPDPWDYGPHRHSHGRW